MTGGLSDKAVSETRGTFVEDHNKRAGKKRMDDDDGAEIVKVARDHNKSRIAGSPKFVKFAVLPPNKPGETNVNNKIKKQRRDKPVGKKAEVNHIKLNFARKNWEEAMNPAAALARTKKSKEGANVSTGAHVPQGEHKAIAKDAANRLFDCRDDDNVTELIGETEVAFSSIECTPKASELLFSDTGSCYYGERNVEKVNAEDMTIYTAVTPTGLCKGIAATSAGPPLTKYTERNDVTKWTEATRALVTTTCCWVAGAFDRSGGAGDDNRSPSASAPVTVPNGIRLIDSDAVEWTEADSFRENNGDYSAGAIKLGVKKPAEAPHPFPFDPCCGAHVLLPTCGRKSDNSVHPCDNSKSGSSRQTGGTRLSADAIEWTATDFVKVDNDCDNLAGQTELEGHRLLSIWMRRLKNRMARKSQPAKQHPQSQYSPGEKEEDTIRSCNTILPFSYTTNGNRVIDSDTFGLTGAGVFREKNDENSSGKIELGDNKLTEEPNTSELDPCCGAHVLLPTCGRKSDNSVHPCDNSKSGSSRQTGGTRLSADAIEWTATDFVKVDNDCDNLAGQTELEGHRLLSIWMRRLKNRMARESQPAKQHPKPQYSLGEKDDDNTRSCNTILPVSHTSNGNRLIDSDAFGLTGADLATSKIKGDRRTVCCAVPSEALGKSHDHNRRLKNNAAREPQPAKQHPKPQYSPGEKDDDNSRSSNTFLPVSCTSIGNRLIDSDAFGSNGADLVTSKINGDGTVCYAVPSEALEKSHGHNASSARKKHQLHDASQLAEASQLADASQLVGYDEKSLVNLSLTKNDTALSDDTSDLMIRIKSALETAQASDQIPSSTLLRKRTVTSNTSSVLRSKTEASSTFSS